MREKCKTYPTAAATVEDSRTLLLVGSFVSKLKANEYRTYKKVYLSQNGTYNQPGQMTYD